MTTKQDELFTMLARVSQAANEAGIPLDAALRFLSAVSILEDAARKHAQPQPERVQ